MLDTKLLIDIKRRHMSTENDWWRLEGDIKFLFAKPRQSRNMWLNQKRAHSLAQME